MLQICGADSPPICPLCLVLLCIEIMSMGSLKNFMCNLKKKQTSIYLLRLVQTLLLLLQIYHILQEFPLVFVQLKCSFKRAPASLSSDMYVCVLVPLSVIWLCVCVLACVEFSLFLQDFLYFHWTGRRVPQNKQLMFYFPCLVCGPVPYWFLATEAWRLSQINSFLHRFFCCTHDSCWLICKYSLSYEVRCHYNSHFTHGELSHLY